MREQLSVIIKKHSEEYYSWIEEKEKQIKDAFSLRTFYLSFSMASRVEGAAIACTEVLELPGEGKYTIDEWELSRLGRVYLMLALKEHAPEHAAGAFKQLFETAELKELVALYSALPFLPDPEEYIDRAAEGIRTNIGPVLEAVILNNPYPENNLPEGLWNQMVLKAVFTDKPLYKIIGLDRRANPNLATMLINFAKERWAAGRVVNPELWRPVGQFLQQKDQLIIQKIIESAHPLAREAAVLAASQSKEPKIQEMSDQYPEIKARIKDQSLTWDSLGKAYWENKN